MNENNKVDYSKEQQTMLNNLRQGSERAFEYFYYKLKGPMTAYARRQISESFTVDTIVQEAFVNAWNLRATLNDPLHFFSLVRQKIKWECYHFVTNPRSKFGRRFTFLEGFEESAAMAVDTEKEQEEVRKRSVEDESLKLIIKAIPYLPGQHKDYIHLYLKYGLNHKKIAAYYGAKYQSVSSKINQAIEQLKQIVNSQYGRKFTQTNASNEKYLRKLDFVSAQIYRLRKFENSDFEEIGRDMALPVENVIMKYTEATYLLNKMKKNEHPKKKLYTKKDTIDSRLSNQG